jgi:hypothetical protein
MAVYPCSDGATCLDEVKAGIVNADQSDHNHGSAEEDLCTPFCICSCCAAHIQLKTSPSYGAVAPLHNTPLATAYLEKPLLTNGQSIWQPPRA